MLVKPVKWFIDACETTMGAATFSATGTAFCFLDGLTTSGLSAVVEAVAAGLAGVGVGARVVAGVAGLDAAGVGAVTRATGLEAVTMGFEAATTGAGGGAANGGSTGGRTGAATGAGTGAETGAARGAGADAAAATGSVFFLKKPWEFALKATAKAAAKMSEFFTFDSSF